MPGNIRFVLPISVLLSCMYTLANFGRNREITAMRSSGISLIRCGFAIYCVGFVVMLVNFWFNEQLIPYSEQQSTMIMEKMKNPNYELRMFSMLQYRSSDKLRDWLFQNFDRKGIQHEVILKQYVIGEDGKKILDSDIRASEAKYVEGEGWTSGCGRTPYNKRIFLPGVRNPIKELKISKDKFRKNRGIVNAVKPPRSFPPGPSSYSDGQSGQVPSLRGMYKTILYYRLAFDVCFLCVLALPLRRRIARGIFLSIITASWSLSPIQV